jgi:Fe-S-cluster-containing dehydrogenase component
MKVFVIDVAKCYGCRTCQIACKDEHCGNNWMPYARPQPLTGQFWRKVDEFERGTMPKVKVYYIAKLCMHCDDAPCIPACPNSAISQRSDGLVWIDPEKCKGAQICVDSCPYGAIYYNTELYLAQKCTGCAHILDRGWPMTEPRCVDACYVGASMFGEESEFSAEIADGERLAPKFGATPNTRVYYLNIPKRFIGGTVYDPGAKEVVIGATCTLSGDGSGTATTDAFGDFWFEGLEVGTFSLTIESDGKTKTIDDINTEKDVNLGDIALS